MQLVTSSEVQSQYGKFLESVQDDLVCVTRHGRPLFWALSDRHVRVPDPSILIGRMLLLHGQLNRGTQERAGDAFGKVLEELDASRDPKDNKFLSLAIDANAITIVTGDDDLKVLHPYKGIAIQSPADFIRLQMPASR